MKVVFPPLAPIFLIQFYIKPQNMLYFHIGTNNIHAFKIVESLMYAEQKTDDTQYIYKQTVKHEHEMEIRKYNLRH